jgi:hypothetical protein
MAGKVSSDPNVFILPDLGEGLEEAELIAWKVSEGDTVEEHQIIAEMETDKALVEVPSPRAGTIATLHGKDGDTIKVGAPFVTYQGSAGSGSKKVAPNTSEGMVPAPTVATRPTATQSADHAEQEDAGTVVGKMGDSLAGMSSKDGKALAAPAVRRLARDLGVDIDTVPGTGIGGRVTANDVRNAADGKTAKPAPSSTPAQRAPSVSERASSPATPSAPPARPAETRRPLPTTPIAPRYNPATQYQAQPPQHYPHPQQPEQLRVTRRCRAQRRRVLVGVECGEGDGDAVTGRHRVTYGAVRIDAPEQTDGRTAHTSGRDHTIERGELCDERRPESARPRDDRDALLGCGLDRCTARLHPDVPVERDDTGRRSGQTCDARTVTRVGAGAHPVRCDDVGGGQQRQSDDDCDGACAYW